MGQPVSILGVLQPGIGLSQGDVDHVSMAEVVPASSRFTPGLLVAPFTGPIRLLTHGCGAFHFESGGGEVA